jgi:hypothetical protein
MIGQASFFQIQKDYSVILSGEVTEIKPQRMLCCVVFFLFVKALESKLLPKQKDYSVILGGEVT